MFKLIRKNLKLIGVYTALILWAIICLAPILFLIAASIKHTALFISPPELFSLSGFTLENYIRAFFAGDMLHFGVNSLIISFSAVFIVLISCAPMAYGITKLRRSSRNAVSFIILSMRFVPYVILAIPMYIIFIRFGITGSRLALVLAHLAIQIPFLSWLLIGFFENVPQEVFDAATIDGCSPFKTFIYIAVPITTPGIIAALILSFITSWNEFLFALFLAGYDAQPLTVGIIRFMGTPDRAADYGIIAAYGLLIVIPVLIFSIIMSRYIIKGLTAGAVKG